MSESTPPEPAESKSFWTTAPGLITAIGGFVAAIATLVTALSATGIFTPKTPTPTDVPLPSATSTVVVVASPTPSPTAVVLAPTATSTLAPTASATAVPTPSRVLYEDDFSADTGDWAPEVRSDYEAGYDNGEFRIAVYSADSTVYDHLKKHMDFTDFAVEVDGRQVSGPEDGAYGLVVRYQSDNAFYLFEVSSTGQYVVFKFQDGEWHDLKAWAAATAIHQSDAWNRLRVVASGSTMHFYVNGESVAEVQDSAFSGGSIGLAAEAYTKGGVVAAFDNLRVRALTTP